MPLKQLAQPPPPQLHSAASGVWQSEQPASPQPPAAISAPHPPDWQPPVVAQPLNPKAATLMAAAIMKNRMSQILLNFLGRLEQNGKLLMRKPSHCQHSSETLA
jgi:predicted component of type VI protein secretion system